MAKLEILSSFVLSWEGGYCNVPGDHGGATNKGVTLATWRKYGYDKNGDRRIDEKDVMLISEHDAVELIMRPVYWNKWLADSIRNQAIANLLVDWYWNSGQYGIKLPQKVLGVKTDGVVGRKTLAAVNDYPNQRELFTKLWSERQAYFRRLATKPGQSKFLTGWLRRLNAIGYTTLTCNGGRVITW